MLVRQAAVHTYPQKLDTWFDWDKLPVHIQISRS